MSKIRVHELAKELNKSSKDVIYALKGHGVDVESHMSTISSENADKIRKFFTQPVAKPAQKQESNRLRIIEMQHHAAATMQVRAA
ncbi:MAG: translation initiation factor IF-2 N-terminal domain-containing protein [Coprococcus sp.]